MEIKIHGASVPNLRVDLHAIDATPARWRGSADSSPLDAPDTLVDFHTGHHEWYEKQGKYLAKKNTFHDFVDCARYLKEQGISGDMSCEGRSAGGLLVGNAVNLAPEAFNACIAGVPFVDLMTTMCDPSIPLTTEEWEEWGNPNEKKYHDYMLSYPV